MSDIKIKYDGKYPNLCSDNLEVTIGEKTWEFPKFCLLSGGSVSFDNEWNEIVEEGDWSVSDWPDDFPEDLKDEVLDAINDSIPHGCCGGCI